MSCGSSFCVWFGSICLSTNASWRILKVTWRFVNRGHGSHALSLCEWFIKKQVLRFLCSNLIDVHYMGDWHGRASQSILFCGMHVHNTMRSEKEKKTKITLGMVELIKKKKTLGMVVYVCFRTPSEGRLNGCFLWHHACTKGYIIERNLWSF